MNNEEDNGDNDDGTGGEDDEDFGQEDLDDGGISLEGEEGYSALWVVTFCG